MMDMQPALAVVAVQPRAELAGVAVPLEDEESCSAELTVLLGLFRGTLPDPCTRLRQPRTRPRRIASERRALHDVPFANTRR